ncbi:hypothetical protein COF04_03705 [Bacillus toyonensis]|uniref:uracil-DNA glycosylase family protein n=1 Tax=Bacillus toyonensis TaxID=155322 RepID=UPI000BFBBA51|nr:uracil-DNA glycosylase family protein [Bacillus toyonensis]PHC05692.1 hypothetical protein COF04_03705 [Bacillus toyonensis]
MGKVNEIIKLHLNFIETVKCNESIMRQLHQNGITILDGFGQNISLVKEYYETWYSSNVKRPITLCGINPGKDGVGLTGIPFMDYKNLARLLEGVDGGMYKPEPSSEFLYSVIEEIGVGEFFKQVYLTNFSWFGFKRKNGNLNYFDLPSTELKWLFTRSFITEMEIMQTKIIIPLSREVGTNLRKLKREGFLKAKIMPRLNHPSYCNYKNRRDEELVKYVTRIRN